VIGEKDADSDAKNCIVAKQPITKVVGDRGAMIDVR
jgi:hypothetical protein